MIIINRLKPEPYEAFAAFVESEEQFFAVSRDASSGRTRVRIASASRDMSFAVYLTSEELDALQTMLAEAYDSLEAE